MLTEEDERDNRTFVSSLQESQDAMGSLFVDCWDKLGFFEFGPSYSSILTRCNNGIKTKKKNLVGKPPLLILDFMTGKE